MSLVDFHYRRYLWNGLDLYIERLCASEGGAQVGFVHIMQEGTLLQIQISPYISFCVCLFVFGDLVTIPWLDRQVCLVPDARKAEDSMMYYLEPRKKRHYSNGLSLFFVFA